MFSRFTLGGRLGRAIPAISGREQWRSMNPTISSRATMEYSLEMDTQPKSRVYFGLRTTNSASPFQRKSSGW